LHESSPDNQNRIRTPPGRTGAAEVRRSFGATVELEDEDSGTPVTYQIVGDLEADIKKKMIAVSSPIARALIGRSQGDSVEFTAPNGVKHYEVISIKYV
jgi:transcription elongation factor GreA